jgi:hypothetical protein
MRILSTLTNCWLLGMCLVQVLHAAPDKQQKIDPEAIHKAYTESDWEQIKTNLEGVLRKQGDANVSREERILAYKYLGVICAADSTSRPKAISYFNRLLDLSPNIEIVDLFPSEKVTEIFNATKREKESQTQYMKNHDRFGNALTPQPSSRTQSLPMPARATPKAESSNWLWWTAGSALAVGAAVSTYVMVQSGTETKIVTQKTELNGETPVLE